MQAKSYRQKGIAVSAIMFDPSTFQIWAAGMATTTVCQIGYNINSSFGCEFAIPGDYVVSFGKGRFIVFQPDEFKRLFKKASINV